MSDFTVVPLLRIEAASGLTLYPGENGFSAAWGEVESDSPELGNLLDIAVSTNLPITLRCGLLEVTGRLQHQERAGTHQSYKISLESVRYGGPGSAA